jgi:hypothetical protein
MAQTANVSPRIREIFYDHIFDLLRFFVQASLASLNLLPFSGGLKY